MLSKSLFTRENFRADLVETVGQRLNNEEYTDAILAGFRCLTNTLRRVGGVEGDGVQLVGKVLGGNEPAFTLNKLETVSEKDEQKGIEQLIRGMYTGIRNPRAHERTKDTEDDAIRFLILIDLCLQYLDRESQEFNVTDFVNRIYEPHFVADFEYTKSLLKDISPDQVIPIFFEAFNRRTESKANEIKYAFFALYEFMSAKDLQTAINVLGDALRTENELTGITNILHLLRAKDWRLLQDDVRMRLEKIIIDACRSGTYDFYNSKTTHRIGSWGNVFGSYFDRKDELVQTLIRKLNMDWFNQNFVGMYYMFSLMTLVDAEKSMTVARCLAYAALVNDAKVVRNQLLKVALVCPDFWRSALKVAVQEHKKHDLDYASKLLVKLG